MKKLVYLWNVGPSRFLVKMSASLVVPDIHWITSTPASFSSSRNTDWTSMCLVLLPTLQLMAKYTTPWLSISRTIGSLTLSPSYSRTFFIWSMSCMQVTPRICLCLSSGQWHFPLCAALEHSWWSLEIHHVSQDAAPVFRLLGIVQVRASTYGKLVILAAIPCSVGLEHQTLVSHVHTVL